MVGLLWYYEWHLIFDVVIVRSLPWVLSDEGCHAPNNVIDEKSLELYPLGSCHEYYNWERVFTDSGKMQNQLHIVVKCSFAHGINKRIFFKKSHLECLNDLLKHYCNGKFVKAYLTRRLQDVNDSGVLSLIYHNFRQKQIERPITENKHDNSGVDLEISDNGSV